jgi:ATP-dependent exoDNAse (exonuclease V) alpha subunit
MTQKEAFDILKLGYNVYLTGAAGSGKTYLLNQYISYLRTNGIGVGITASTGIAATHMGGTTIHSFAGMGIRDVLTEADMTDLFKRAYLRTRFSQTKVLIIDEISMLHAHRLDMVDMVCRAFKRNSFPFGGMQVIMCGDFFQLPPVVKTESRSDVRYKVSDEQGEKLGLELESSSEKEKKGVLPFVTESKVWQEMQLRICYLDEQFRQDDRAFLRVLNDIRNNEVSEMTVETLSERLGQEVKGYVKPTRLFTHNADVDAINQKHLTALEGESRTYYMSSRGSYGLAETLKRSCLAPDTLVLKKGAQVIFVKNNYELGYVNGTLGEVLGFSAEGLPIVRTFDGDELTVGEASWDVKEDGVEKAAISQLPLRLAWAITVHKSQGMSLDAAEVDLSRAFIPGMGYVALSRVRSLSGLKLIGMNQMALTINQDVAEMDKEFRRQSDEVAVYLSGMEQAKKEKMQEETRKYLKGK